MKSEVAAHADFSPIRYAQCWEDADILLEALDIQPQHVCLSIASAGDNTLAMLSRGPARVVAIDLSPAQLACLELRVAAYTELSYPELLVFMGSRTGTGRADHYHRCRPHLSTPARDFWDAHGAEIERGIGGAGEFERYFRLFRERVLPLIHNRRRVERLLQGGSAPEREAFYEQEWNTWRWRLLFHLFFSRFVMGRAGRDPGFFRYVQGSVAARILGRTKHALTALNPANNPYLQWILTGHHTSALPYALRPENFDAIRANLHRLEWKLASVEDWAEQAGAGVVDRYNLSDIFEYMSEENYHRLLERIVSTARPGARLAYWNMLAPRHRPDSMSHVLQPLDEISSALHAQDKAFFYSDFVVEQVVHSGTTK